MSAKYDPTVYTSNARATFLDRFAREVDPENTLPAAERLRRAAAARKLYFARLALSSATKRAEKRKTASSSGKPEAVHGGPDAENIPVPVAV